MQGAVKQLAPEAGQKDIKCIPFACRLIRSAAAAIARELREKTEKDCLIHELSGTFDVSLWHTLKNTNLKGEVQQLIPVELSDMALHKMKGTAENYQGKDVKHAVWMCQNPLFKVIPSVSLLWNHHVWMEEIKTGVPIGSGGETATFVWKK